MFYNILIVDDQKDIRELLSDVLRDEGYVPHVAADGLEALESIKENVPHLIILDIWLNESRFDGIELLDVLKQKFPLVPVIMISGHGTIETAISTVQKGAFDFIEKPFRTDRLLNVVFKALESARLQQELVELHQHVHGVKEVQGISLQIEQLRKNITKIAQTNSRVLIQGGPGSGKEIVARSVHLQSSRSHHPFVLVNCAALNQQNFDSIFLGEHTETLLIGVFEKANGGTLFLDDIHELSPNLQARLVPLIREQKFQRVGGARSISVDVRIISSTSVRLESQNFRQDLFYRLNVIPLKIPSLKDRQEDIMILAQYYLDKFSSCSMVFSTSAQFILKSYDWPGNVAQLKNIIERTVILAPPGIKEITPELLPTEITLRELSQDVVSYSQLLHLPIKEAREQFERDYINLYVQRFNGNIARTAQEIGMERTALHRKLKSLNIGLER